MKAKEIKLEKYGISISNNKPFVLIAGNCVIENERSAFETAKRLKDIANKACVSLIFKASYDKANRSSIKSYRGPGIDKGLDILSEIKAKLKIPVLTDVHSVEEVEKVGKVVDMIQIPAFLCRQTDLVCACAKTGLPVNVKKGQFLAPEDMENIVVKIEECGNKNILLTERGTSFGYHNLVVDMRSIEIMKELGYPVIFDATHSVQLPGGRGLTTGGQSQFINPLSRAAAALGVAGFFLEVHENPSKALSDGPNSLKLSDTLKYLKELKAIDEVIKNKS